MASKNGRVKVHYGNAIFFQICFIFRIFEGSYLHFFQMVDVSIFTQLSLFNILISKCGVKDGYHNTLIANFAITMFYNLQNASFMHISSPINAIEKNLCHIEAFC